MKEYNHKKIEKKWQKYWSEKKVYEAKDGGKKEKIYVLDMFPYPSGEGLHVGHPKGFIATDIYSRFKRMNNFNVLHPMGWDAFGLPAENYALKNKIHPEIATKKNVARYKKQISILGLDYDWKREVNTTDPEYYKWTQWIFLQMFKKGLAYESEEPINWCPSCKTGLANEDLEDGKCERCGSEIEQKPIRQWVLKITDYADRLLEGLDKLNWPESVKELQRNWIGRSEGAEIDFNILIDGKKSKEKVKIFTTRPDTLFGATYLVLAPENKVVSKIKDQISNKNAVENYIKETKKKTELQRTAEDKKKIGVELKGIKAINPVNGEEIPIWIADYVLGHYGTGAIMAVPAHDERDYEFAKKFNLPIKQVIAPFFIDPVNPPKKGKKWSTRRNIQIIVKHPSEKKIIQIYWKKQPWKTLVIGGAEDGESYEEAAIRELKEETGYKNIKSIRAIGWQMESHFYAAHKNINRQAFTQVFEMKLKDLEQEELSEEEKDLHNIVWVPENEISSCNPMSEKSHILDSFNKEECAYTGEGVLINSGDFDGMESEEARKEITKFVKGKKKVTYKLRDWVFSRQRYWGEPIPLIHCEKCGVVPVPENELPLELPKVKNYEPTGTGESPLLNISKWVNTKCPECKGKGKRETNTMPQWAGSCWYYLRYIDPKNKKRFVDAKKEKYWMPVDMYVGGVEHATRHLIYARFWHKFLYDIGVVSSDEPFLQLKNQGLISGSDGRKMSKRWGNVVNPDDVVDKFGADTMRVYEMFLGPFEQGSSWNNDGIMGSRRFLEKIWRLARKTDHSLPSLKESMMDKTVKKIGEDIENFSFNTAISSLMILSNHLEKKDKIPTSDFEILIRILAPFAPHVAEEMWSNIGKKKSVHISPWPGYNESNLLENNVTIAVQVNGKVRGEIEIERGSSESKVLKKAMDNSNVSKWCSGKKILKVIYVLDKIINVIVPK